MICMKEPEAAMYKHLHGELMKCHPVNQPQRIYDISPEQPDILLGDTDPEGTSCARSLYGLEKLYYDRTCHTTGRRFGYCSVIGTSLNVYPAAGLLNYVRRDNRSS